LKRKRSSLDRVAIDFSDLHDGNRTVIEVVLMSGDTWFYKPRAGHAEARWNEFLRSLYPNVFPFPFKVLRMHCGRSHFWMEGIEPMPSRSREQSLQLYYRSGALLYLLHILRAVDCHFENVIMHAAHPVLIDCETLLHPSASDPASSTTNKDSIIATGLLPKPGWSPARSVSALGAAAAREIFLSIPELRAQIADGFQFMHQSLMTHSGCSLFRHLVRRLASGPTRYIAQPTAHYYGILAESVSPDLLWSSRARGRYLSAKCRQLAVSAAQARQEAAALRNADIPRFYRQSAAPRPFLDAKEMRGALQIIGSAFC
jgi:lantibiotic modifying enzyme